MTDEERRIQRQKQAKPILDAYWAWVDTIRLPSGKLKDAVTYALNQREYLCSFLEALFKVFCKRGNCGSPKDSWSQRA
jgi:hypothetical protein